MSTVLMICTETVATTHIVGITAGMHRHLPEEITIIAITTALIITIVIVGIIAEIIIGDKIHRATIIGMSKIVKMTVLITIPDKENAIDCNNPKEQCLNRTGGTTAPIRHRKEEMPDVRGEITAETTLKHQIVEISFRKDSRPKENPVNGALGQTTAIPISRGAPIGNWGSNVHRTIKDRQNALMKAKADKADAEEIS